MATVGTLKRLSASSLSALLLAEQAAAAGDPAVAVIDVRDDGRSCPPFPMLLFSTNLPIPSLQIILVGTSRAPNMSPLAPSTHFSPPSSASYKTKRPLSSTARCPSNGGRVPR